MKYILEETTHKYILSEKYILIEKNRRTEVRPLEQGQELVKNYISKFISRITGHGNYKVINPEAAGVPTLKDKDLKPDLRHLLANNENGWLQADENNLSYWAELKAKRLKAEEKLIIDDRSKTIQIKTEDSKKETKEYTVTFFVDTNKTIKKVKEGEKVEEPVDPSKMGYEFKGWFTETEFKNQYDFNTLITTDLTLYAKFDAKEDSNADQNEFDWGERYRSSKNKNAFWDLYYEKVWHKDEQIFNKVKELGEAFRQELTILGFRRELNPMIEFVEKYWKKLNHENYTAIHDSLANKFIDEKDVRGNGVLKNSNIIFSDDLYSKSYKKIVEYLELQKEISNLPIKTLTANDADGKVMLETANNSIEKLAFILLFKVPNNTSSNDINKEILDSHENIEVKLLKLGTKINKRAEINVPNFISKISTADEAMLAIAALINKFANKVTKNNIYKIIEEPLLASDKGVASLIKEGDNASKYFEYNNQLLDVSPVDSKTLFDIVRNICTIFKIKIKEEK